MVDPHRKADRVMQLYLVERIGSTGYDEAAGFVIRADTPKDARKMAANEAGDEGPHTWMDTRYSTCKVLTGEGPAGIVLTDFLAG
jgi:hypothetical protein